MTTPVRGAGRCPRCASRKVLSVEMPDEVRGDFYARSIEVCGNCHAAWEPIDRALLWDAADPVGSFSAPCDNCAFRPGSVEQRDRDGWIKTIGALKAGGRFYCHKGVPIAPANPDGFAYPRDAAGQPNPRKLRLCRGWLNTLGPLWAKRAELGSL